MEMKQKIFAELTDKELLKEAKNIKSINIYDSLIWGVLIGIALYSTIKNGFGLLTFLPLLFAPISVKNKTKIKELKRLLKERNLSKDM